MCQPKLFCYTFKDCTSTDRRLQRKFKECFISFHNTFGILRLDLEFNMVGDKPTSQKNQQSNHAQRYAGRQDTRWNRTRDSTHLKLQIPSIRRSLTSSRNIQRQFDRQRDHPRQRPASWERSSQISSVTNWTAPKGHPLDCIGRYNPGCSFSGTMLGDKRCSDLVRRPATMLRDHAGRQAWRCKKIPTSKFRAPCWEVSWEVGRQAGQHDAHKVQAIAG